MKNRISEFKVIVILILSILISSCEEPITYDLAIKNVAVFDSNNKEVLENKTILINADTIAAIVNSKSYVKATQIIEGNGRLVSPGFVDTHVHLTMIYGDYEKAPEVIPEDSLEFYRQKLSDTYLKYGTTTIRVTGQPEKWINPTLSWQKNPLPEYPDIYICGGALVSPENRETYLNHVVVSSPIEARQKVQDYYERGIRHIKLYWRLRSPEFRAAIQKAQELDMNVCGDISQNVMFIDSTMALGLKNYEHVYTPLMSVFRYDQYWDGYIDFVNTHNNLTALGFFVLVMEAFGYVHQHPELDAKMNKLLDEMATQEVNCSSAIHLFAEKGGLTYFQGSSPNKSDSIALSQYSTERYKENFDIMMAYTKRLHDKGTTLTLGTDCENGGKAALSEMLLFYEAGFSIEDILQIVTLNGAKAIGLDQLYGSIQTGKKANLVIFEKNPFDDYKNFLSSKVVIKDGKIYEKK